VETAPAAKDHAVLDLATRHQRILLTEDKDFGRLVHVHSRGAVGVLFLRFPGNARTRLCESLVDLVKQKGERLVGRFVVVQPGRIRIHRAPTL
jgi:predicted nuclease of predicted toxin-antitoxin system